MEHPSPHPTPPAQAPNPLVLAVAASLVAGFLGGGLAGWLVGSGRLPSVTNSTVRSGTVKVTEESATVDVVESASPAVVSIVVTKDYSKIYGESNPYRLFGFPYYQLPSGKQEVGGGSGFIVSADGTIVTNKHVVDDTQAEYTVVLNDKRRFDATVLATDPVQDIAVLKVEASDLPTVELGDSDTLQIGQTVVAIGNALGEYQNTVTQGIVSGLSRTITAGDSSGNAETLENVIQTDAAINPGNSGGPLLNLAGQVVGMNTAVNQGGQLIGFAIPINLVQGDLESVRTSGKITQTFLGVRYIPVDDQVKERFDLSVNYGVLLQKGSTEGDAAVVAASPAEKAGLKEGDVILEVNGVKLDADHSLAVQLRRYKPGDTVELKVITSGKERTVRATLEERK